MAFLNKSNSFLLYFLTTLLLFASCTQKQQAEKPDLPGYTQRTIKLINGVGTVSIFLPDEFDTAFSFKDYSDDGADAYQGFQFANKKYTVVKEVDFAVPTEPDSICKKDSSYQFTITQALYLLSDSDNNRKIDSTYIEDLKHRYKVFEGPHWHTKVKLLKINTRDFAIIEERNRNRIFYGNRDSNKFLFTLKGTTIVKKRWVSFCFRSLKKDTTGFMYRAMKSMGTIEISN